MAGTCAYIFLISYSYHYYIIFYVRLPVYAIPPLQIYVRWVQAWCVCAYHCCIRFVCYIPLHYISHTIILCPTGVFSLCCQTICYGCWTHPVSSRITIWICNSPAFTTPDGTPTNTNPSHRPRRLPTYPHSMVYHKCI